MLQKLCVKLALPKLERNLSDLRFLWAWGLRPIWMATFHALLFVLGLVSLDPGIVLQLASMIVSLVARLLILGPLIRFVTTPLAALSSKVTIFSSTALFTMHFKVHGVCGGTIEDRQWLLACRDIEIVGLSLAIATLETELGITDEDETTLLRGWLYHITSAFCLLTMLTVPMLLIFFLASSRGVGLAIRAPFATPFSCSTWVL